MAELVLILVGMEKTWALKTGFTKEFGMKITHVSAPNIITVIIVKDTSNVIARLGKSYGRVGQNSKNVGTRIRDLFDVFAIFRL